MTIASDWPQRIGYQRDWIWRGWQIRYTFRPASDGDDCKPPILLVHGFGAAIEHWRHNMSVLSQFYRVYAIDLLGFGGSRKADVPFSVDLWTAQIYDFWQAAIGEPTILVGNSMGSAICLNVTARYPSVAAGLVAINLPDVSVRQEAIPRSLQPLVRAIEGLFGTRLLLGPLFRVLRRRSVLRSWAAIAYCDRSAVNEELIEILGAPARDDGAEQTFCRLCQSVNQPDFSPSIKATLPTLNLPILLVWGDRDRMVPPSLAPIFARLNPRIRLVELENAGHCPHDEVPDLFNERLLDWLNDVG